MTLFYSNKARVYNEGKFNLEFYFFQKKQNYYNINCIYVRIKL